MDTTIAQQSTGLPAQSKRITKPREIVDAAQERMYIRFFIAAAFGLALGGIQGFIQRLPGIQSWIYAAGYGGHLITNLAQTHVEMVGAGTLTVTALMYYILPRILNRPLYSHALSHWSFWLTVIGVYSFYFTMLAEGVVLGNAVVHGVDYDTVRHMLGAWYDVPTGLSGGLMGVGYWLFVANIYLTLRGPRNWKGPEKYIAKYILIGVTGLFIGTVQGFLQVMPAAVDFIRKTGQAGELIDPVAHAHINMVAGMAMTLMGMSFYIVPRWLNKPIWNPKLANISFWFTGIGVLGFWLSNLALGIIEGNIMLGIMSHSNNLDIDTVYDMATAQVGIWHPLLQAGFGIMMGVGFWLYIAVIYRTFAQKMDVKAEHVAFPSDIVEGDKPVPPADINTRFMALFFVASATSMLIGTIQGVIQIQPFALNWLDSAGQAGDLITPLAHAQMNIIASIGFGLMGLVYFALPKISGKEWMSHQLTRVTFILMVIGMFSYYFSLLTLGFIESTRVHALLDSHPNMTDLDAFNQVLSQIGWAHPFWLSFSNSFIALAYICHAINVVGTLGPKNMRVALEDWVLQAAGLFDRSLAVNRPQMVRDISKLRWGAARAFLVEVGAGTLGFVGSGWIVSGRLAFGFALMFTWLCGWIVTIEWILATQSQLYGPDFSFVVPLLPLYVSGVLLSAICSGLTYLRRGLKKKPLARTAPKIIESSAVLIDEPSTITAQ
jgi:cbb3-type cytochrome oxidase subunit 1